MRGARAAADAVAGRARRARRLGAGGTRPGQYRSDLAADEAAVGILSDAGLGVLSEESGLHDADRPLLAVVDPLDGSTNASHGLPWYATSICVLDAEGPLAAVVVNQASGVRYDAVRAGGATAGRRPIARFEDARRSVARSSACPAIPRAISVGASTGRSAPQLSTSAPSPRDARRLRRLRRPVARALGLPGREPRLCRGGGCTSSTRSARSSWCVPTPIGAPPSAPPRLRSSRTSSPPAPRPPVLFPPRPTRPLKRRQAGTGRSSSGNKAGRRAVAFCSR